MEEKVINELNTVLKGEQMAVDAYERFIKDTNNGTVKKEFQEIQQDHRKHVGALSQRIQTLGGEPDYGTGFTGFLASAINSMQNIGENETKDILKKAYDGEDKGIAMVEEIVKGDLDSESAVIVNGILSKDHDHLRRMVELIADHGDMN